MGLGTLKDFSPKEAGKRARDANQMLADRKDPIEVRLAARDADRRERDENQTFKKASQEYLKVHISGWKNPKHIKQWESTLESYAYPTLGPRPLKAIDEALINGALAANWSRVPETTNRVKQRIKKIIAWVKAGKPLPRRKENRHVNHHASMPYPELPAFWQDLTKREGIAARALQFLILTAARTNEVTGAVWDEIKLADKVWVIPPERMKMSRPHRVPLSDAALAILKALPREKGNKFVFCSLTEPGKALSNMAMSMLLRRMGHDDITVHGFRSTFRTWAGEKTSFPHDVIELCLAHQVGTKVTRAYQRSDLLEKRRPLMATWAKFASAKPVKVSGNNVVALRAGA
jgi:integrase